MVVLRHEIDVLRENKKLEERCSQLSSLNLRDEVAEIVKVHFAHFEGLASRVGTVLMQRHIEAFDELLCIIFCGGP